MNRPIVLAAGGLLVVAGGLAGLTFALSGTESTTALDGTAVVTLADGSRALNASIVAGRIESKYHPLPWVGRHVTDVACPSPLPAKVAASIVCTGKAGSSSVTIDARVVKASSSSITWKFDR